MPPLVNSVDILEQKKIHYINNKDHIKEQKKLYYQNVVKPKLLLKKQQLLLIHESPPII